MPEAESPESAKSWLSLDFMYKSLAFTFVEPLMNHSRADDSLQLKIIGLGALTYADIYTGDHYSTDPIRDFLRL